MEAKRVFFVGARPTRERLKDFLATSALTSTGASRTLAEAHSALCDVHREAERPDILLVDIDDPLDGDEAGMLLAILGKQPAMKIVVLGDPNSLALLWQACPIGIDGYLLHTMPPTMMMHGLDRIMSGQQILPPCSHAATPAPRIAPRMPMAADATTGLSTREAQILRQFVAGLPSKTIARNLAISHETVRVQLRAILRKLSASNRRRASLPGIEQGPDRSTVPARSSEAIANQAAASSVVDEVAEG